MSSTVGFTRLQDSDFSAGKSIQIKVRHLPIHRTLFVYLRMLRRRTTNSQWLLFYFVF